MIYQELALATHLTVEANIMLGQERQAGLIQSREHRRLVTKCSPFWNIRISGPKQGSRPERGRPATGRGGQGSRLQRG